MKTLIRLFDMLAARTGKQASVFAPRILAGLALIALASAPGVRAQTPDAYPSRAITIIVPFTAAGTTDILARLVAQKLSEKFDKTVVVENRPGAGGNIGTALVAKAPPDGYTLVMATIGTHAINSSLYKSMPFDAIRDFTPLTRVAMVPNVLVVNKDAPYNTVQELIAYGKANPGKLSFGSGGGAGSSLSLAAELFRLRTGLTIINVPYKGAANALTDLLGGHIDAMFDALPVQVAQVKAGSVTGLAVTSAQRSPALPQVPTMMESGFKDFEAYNYFGLLATPGTPKPIVNKLHDAVVKAVASPDVVAEFEKQGMNPVGGTPEDFAKMLAEDLERWTKVIKEAGIEPQ